MTTDRDLMRSAVEAFDAFVAVGECAWDDKWIALGAQMDAIRATLAVEPEKGITLTPEEIVQLLLFSAAFSGRPIQGGGAYSVPVTVEACPPDGLDEDGERVHYKHVVYSKDYPEDGCFGLGPRLPTYTKEALDAAKERAAKIASQLAALCVEPLPTRAGESVSADADQADMCSAVVQWMHAHGYATGHGDSIDDLLTHLVREVDDRHRPRPIETAPEDRWSLFFDRGSNCWYQGMLYPPPTKNDCRFQDTYGIIRRGDYWVPLPTHAIKESK